MKSKILLILIFVVATTSKLFAQCDIEKISINDSVNCYKFNFEQITDFVELDEGGLIIFLDNFIYSKNKGRGFNGGFSLYLGKILTSSTFAPRKIEIILSDKSSEIFEAEAYTVLGSDTDKPLFRYVYPMTVQQMKRFINYDVEKITLIDTRLRKNVFFTPYHDIFKTQLQCVGDAALKEFTN